MPGTRTVSRNVGSRKRVKNVDTTVGPLTSPLAARSVASRLKTPAAFCVIALLLPFTVSLTMAVKLSVPAPHLDQWDYEGNSLVKLYNHSLTIADLFAQHNESRIALPRALALLYAPATGWDVRYEVGLTLLCAVLLAVGLNILALRDHRLTVRQQLCCVLVADLAVLSCAQWEVLVFGAYYFIVPSLTLTWALVIKQTSWSYTRKTSAWIILSLIATLCYINGVLVWLFGAACSAAPESETRDRKGKVWALVVYCCAGVLTLVLYFASYQRPSNHPSIVGSLFEPMRLIRYYMVWLGAPLGFGPSGVQHSLVLGVGLLISFILAATYVIVKLRSGLLFGTSFAWLLISGFVLTTGVAVSVGRSGFGVEQALSSRYQTFSTVFLPGVFSVLMLCGNEAVSRLRDGNRIVCTAILSFVTGAGFVLFALSSSYGWADAKSYGEMRRRAELAVEFATVIPDNPQLSLSYPGPETIVQVCKQLSAHHLPWINEPAKSIARLVTEATPFRNGANGSLDRVSDIGGGQLVVSGWAILKQDKKPADGVLLVWRGDDGRVKPVSVVPVNGERPDVASAVGTKDVLSSGFDSAISKANFPGSGVITAWAIDSGRRLAYPLRVVKSARVTAN